LAAALLPLAVIGFGVSTSTAAPGANGAERVRVIVAYKDGQRSSASRALAMAGAEIHYDFASLRGYAASVPVVSLDGLSRNPAFDYIEEDAKRYALTVDADGGDEQPYGILAVQAAPTTTSGPLDTNAGNVTVCIIDSGLDTTHPDHAAGYGGQNPKIRGYSDSGTGSWTDASPKTWFTDENHHGTHVAGTIAALNNGLGVVGVAPNGKLNLFIVKVFGADGWAYSSTLVDALNRCTTGRNTYWPSSKLVVSMSLGGSLKSRTEETAFASAYSNGTLSIAAAGNDGNSRLSYPAGYASVISVAAVDSSNAWATFSQYNSDVELAAPGVGVLSTVPVGTGRDSTVTANGSPVASAPMDGSPVDAFSGGLVDCGTGASACPGPAGKVCLIQRGTNTFAEKVANCQASGGKAAIIYNNVAGMLYGTLGGAVTTIPSVGISDADGVALKSKLAANQAVTAAVAVARTDYAYFDGTSMATPHVSGVAALVWGEKSSCTNAQVRSALTGSAQDLGAAGRDVYFGYGLVQAQAAIANLGTNCGGTSGGGGGGKGKP
jgi:subtilisin family serine protease